MYRDSISGTGLDFMPGKYHQEINRLPNLLILEELIVGAVLCLSSQEMKRHPACIIG